MMSVLTFANDDFTAVAVGAKARNLQALHHAGFRVPSGFVICSADAIADLSEADVAAIGGFPVAVRSNGLAEDGVDKSFAGQFASFLNVGNMGELKRCAAACFASAATPAVREYGATHQQSMQVLVQRMVEPLCSGVAFTLNPVTGAEEIVCEMVAGLADEMLAGQVRGNIYRVDYNGRLLEQKEVQTLSLPADFFKLLSDNLLEVQAYFGRPQDIEWAFDGAVIQIIQSRPVTTQCLLKTSDIYSTADFREGGIGSSACTQFLYDRYEEVFSRSLADYFRKIHLYDSKIFSRPLIAQFYARGYWNVSVVTAALKKIPGFDPVKFYAGLGIRATELPEAPAATKVSLTGLIKIVPTLLQLYATFHQTLGQENRWQKDFHSEEQWFKYSLGKLSRLSATELWNLLNDWREFHAVTEYRYFWTIYNSTNSMGELEAQISKLAKRGVAIQIHKLTQGLGDVAHKQMYLQLSRLAVAYQSGAKVDKLINVFFDDYYYVADAELDLRVPRWSEDKNAFKQRLAAFTSSWSNHNSADEFTRELQALLPCIPFRQRSLFKYHLRRCRQFLSMREKLRIHSSKCYAIGRRILLEVERRLLASGHLALGQSIFDFNLDEIMLYKNYAAADFQKIAAKRRKYFHGLRYFIAPEELGVHQRRTPTIDRTSGMVGMAVSPGIVEGPARIVRGPEDFSKVLAGDIVVAKFTDPGWTPVLAKSAAVVTEIGGMLCHAAIICREFGLPAVLNIAGACQEITDGERLRVDGESGIVQRL